ncbi:MAG TPA: DUF167 domain-containing protein [Streptosporangiaceae bacterium]|jgi:hypothetical protein
MRLTIWVRPGSARPRIGGERAGALVVNVTARAVHGQATEAALRAVADAFKVRRAAVALVSGATSRTKIIEVEGGDPGILSRLLQLAEPDRTR